MANTNDERLLKIGQLLIDAKKLIIEHELAVDEKCIAGDVPDKDDYCPHCRAAKWLRDYLDLYGE